MAGVNPIDGAPESAAAKSLARRREARREEFAEQSELARLLSAHLNPQTTFWTGLENRATSRLSGFLQKRRGIRSGLPDFVVLHLVKRTKRTIPVFLELKSKRGVVTRAQKVVRAELLPVGAKWLLVRTARAGLVALRRSRVTFQRKWRPPKLKVWEGPFDTAQHLPLPPEVVAERREAKRRWRERQRARNAAQHAAAARYEGAQTPEVQRLPRRARRQAEAVQAARPGRAT
jgi:hypothetical protein